MRNQGTLCETIRGKDRPRRTHPGSGLAGWGWELRPQTRVLTKRSTDGRARFPRPEVLEVPDPRFPGDVNPTG